MSDLIVDAAWLAILAVAALGVIPVAVTFGSVVQQWWWDRDRRRLVRAYVDWEQR